MNALVPSTPRRGVEKALADCEARFITERPWTFEAYRQIVDRGDALPNCTPSARAAERAREVLTLAPAVAELSRYVEDTRAAAEVVQTEDAPIRAMIGMLLDAFPHSRPPNLAAYAGAMLHDVVGRGYSPAVVAIACRELRRELKYPPAISEMLAACDRARSVLETSATVGERLLGIVTAAQRLANSSIEGEAA